MNKQPMPILKATEPAGYILAWHHEGKGLQKYFDTYAAAREAYSQQLAAWIMYPLQAWLRQHSYLAAAVEKASPYRAEWVKSLHADIKFYEKHPARLSVASFCTWLQNGGLQKFKAAMPGKKSRYYAHSAALYNWLSDQSRMALFTNPTTAREAQTHIL